MGSVAVKCSDPNMEATVTTAIPQPTTIRVDHRMRLASTASATNSTGQMK